MAFLLSAKGGDVTAWRAAEEFATAYRQELLNRSASSCSDSAETIFAETCDSLESVIATQTNLLHHMECRIADAATAASVSHLKEMTGAFYGDLYRHFSLFRSVPAFYQLSMAFLRQASAAIVAQATGQLGLFARHLPEMTLIAVGPAGRCEYSPFCPLQILLVHGEAEESQLQTITQFCHTLHAGFEEAGLAVDPVISPRNARWRGTPAEWLQRCEEGILPFDESTVYDLHHLVDQYPLHPAEGSAPQLMQQYRSVLNDNRTALSSLIVRMTSHSNGLGFMGRLKLERSGNRQGMFGLQEYGLLPLSEALSALALIHDCTSVGTCEKIHELLRRRELDVELAERMLTTWQSLHGMRLMLEQTSEPAEGALFLNPDEMSAEQRQMLKKDLESVAAIQLHVVITFSGMGE